MLIKNDLIQSALPQSFYNRTLHYFTSSLLRSTKHSFVVKRCYSAPGESESLIKKVRIPAGQKVKVCVMRRAGFLAQSRCKIKYLQQKFFVVCHTPIGYLARHKNAWSNAEGNNEHPGTGLFWGHYSMCTVTVSVSVYTSWRTVISRRTRIKSLYCKTAMCLNNIVNFFQTQ